jgi:DNA-binding response OmpR family regulator
MESEISLTLESIPTSIVLVDDETDLVQLFSDALWSSGLDTIPFDSPLKALDYIIENHSKILLVLTDWRMPEINGLELSKRVSQIDDKIKIMIMSAFELEQDQLKEINMDDYLQKPLHMNQLIDTVKKEVYRTIIPESF